MTTTPVDATAPADMTRPVSPSPVDAPSGESAAIDPASLGEPGGFTARLTALADNIEQVIVGKRGVIELAIVCLLARGHLLIEDVPGVGKTTLAKALARSIGGTFGRIQFTPDLLPTDVIGVDVWKRDEGEFVFRPGPIFANVLVADEVNRASPKTQSALLEAMAEQQVTVDGTSHPLPHPFMVLATENPVEHEGTYPLPESQLDRFCMRLAVGYPAPTAEIDLLAREPGSAALDRIGPVLSPEMMTRLTAAVDRVNVATSLRRYLVSLAGATRDHPAVAVGMSPRATLTLQQVARARAATKGRGYVIPDDVRDVLGPVVAHRLILTPDARVQGVNAERILSDIVHRLPVPTGVDAV